MEKKLKTKMSVSPLSDKDIRKLVYGDAGKQAEKNLEREKLKNVEQEDEELRIAISEHDDYIPLDFEDPVELLLFIDDNFRKGIKKLHSWQEEELIRISRTGVYTFKEPLKEGIVAANGSGKDAFVISIIALWLLVSRVRSRTIITSASYNQLKNQTENYIKFYGSKLNTKLASNNVHSKACIIKREHIGCNLTGSEIIMFVTDDPGKAEGFHPNPDYGHNIGLKESIVIDNKRVYPGGDVTFIENEAKSIPDDIDEALGRGTYNRLLKISSSGGTSGHFYRDYKKAVEYPAIFDKSRIYFRRITSYDCPHISKVKIEQDKEYYGENSPIFRSKHLALFTSVNECVVITREALQSCLDYNPEKLDLNFGRRAGLDTAAGGDENCLYVFEENILIGWESFTIQDTSITPKYLIEMFHKWHLKEFSIFADDGGISHGIIDNLWAAGWRINRVRNQSPAFQKLHYGNRGAELYFNFARLIQEKVVNLKKAPQKAIDQLSSRYYKQQEGLGKLILESKKEARASGHGSPDHADAIVLAWSGITIDDFRGRKAFQDKTKHVVTDPVEAVMKKRDEQFEQLKEKKVKPFARSNISALMRGLYDR